MAEEYYYDMPNRFRPSIRPSSAKRTLPIMDFREHVQRKATFPWKKIGLIGALVLVVGGVLAGIALGIAFPKDGNEAFKTSEDNLGGTGSTESPQFMATSTPTTPSSKSTGSVDKTTSSVDTSSTAPTTPSSRSTGSVDVTTSSVDASSTASTTPSSRSTGSVDVTTSSVDTSSTAPTTPSSRSTGSVDETTSSVDTSSTAPTTPPSRSTGSVDETTSSVDTSSTAPTTPPSRSTGSVDKTTSSVDTSSTAPTTPSSRSTGSVDVTTSSVDASSTASTTPSSRSTGSVDVTTSSVDTSSTAPTTPSSRSTGSVDETTSSVDTSSTAPTTPPSRSTGSVDETTSSVDTSSTAPTTPPSRSTGSVDETTSSIDTSSTAPTTPPSRSTGSVDETTSSIDTSSTAPTTPPSRSTGSVDETTSSIDTSSTAPTTPSSRSTGSVDETTSSVDTSSTAPTIPSSISTGSADETTSSVDTFSTASTTTSSGSSTITSTTTTTEETPTNDTITLGIWALWGRWTTCTATCGGGIYKRYRTCTKQSDTDYPCSGENVETAVCNDLQCPQAARWSTWSVWGQCDVTCGGGTQTRDRVCQSDGPTLCVGNIQMSQTCNGWVCPDCSQACSEGSLNVQCDACICDTTLTITVKTHITSVPVYGASIYFASDPTREIAKTNGSGQVTLTTVCLNTEIHVLRKGFQTAIAQVTSTTMDLTLSVLEYPHFTEIPKSKPRLAGESVTFCCVAKASPAVTYYEWFKNGVLLDTALYPNGTHITLPSLTVADSGEYTCRANSPIGAIKSDVATLNVRDSSDEFCSDAFQQRRIQLPSDCVQPDTNSATYEVGFCNPKKCRQSGVIENARCGEDSNSCCGSSLLELVEVQCSGYVLDILAIKVCGCSSCTERSVTLSGTALAHGDGAPLKYGEIWLNGVNQGYTSIQGTFSLSLVTTLTTHTITLKDIYFKDFLEMTKTITIIEGISTMVKTFKLLRVADPVRIPTSLENTLQLCLDENNASSSVASITIPPNAFYTSDGTPYTGKVDARMKFVSLETVPDAEAVPGTFVVVNEEGEDVNLVSAGVFSPTFQDPNGNDINVGKSIEIELNTDTIGDTASSFNLYGLDSITGKWVEIKTPQSQRKKRYAVFGEVNVNEYSWFNLDQATVNQFCYLRAHVYETPYVDQTTPPPIVSSSWMTYIVFINDVTFTYYNSDSIDGCFKIACDGQTGLIDIYSNTHNSYSMPLDPSLLENNEFKSYTVSSNGRVATVTLSPSSNGPFFNTSAACQAWSNLSLVMHFNPPSYSPNIYTFKTKEGIVDGFTYLQIDANPEIEERVWYVDKICMIKATFSGNYQNVKVRATSAGYFSGISKLYGIREISASDIEGVGVACLEYRCSQSSDEKTNVSVGLVSNLYIRCTIDHQNGFFQDNQTGETSFKATVPVDFSPQNGLYRRDLNRLDFETVQGALDHDTMKKLTNQCKSGSAAEDPSSNKAIHFNCVDGLG